MTHSTTDRNLLIGILALQMDFISRDQLVSAMMSWVVDKTKSLDRILIEQNAVDTSTKDLILALVDKHVELHEGNTQDSLAAFSTLTSSIRTALRALGDSEIESSLRQVLTVETDGGSGLPLVDETTRFDESAFPNQSSRFRVLRPHAKGGVGQVSVALDGELNREVALKEIQERFADKQNSRSRFVAEAQITGGLEHPGIVPVYGLGAYSNGRPFYAMRFIKGDSLKEAVDAFHRKAFGSDTTDRSRDLAYARPFESLEFRKLLGRFVTICNAIEYAHSRGVIHRDLKPGNVMLGKYGETLVVDWGLAKVVGRDESEIDDESTLPVSSGSGSAPTQIGSAVGTPAFMSPEQAEGKLDQIGPTSDVYSLGATLFYVLTGMTPFQERDIHELLRQVQRGESLEPREVVSSVPKALEAICLKAMAHSPSERYSSPEELACEIEQWLADAPVDAYAEPISTKFWRWVRHHQTEFASFGIVTIIGLISLGAILSVIAHSNQNLQLANSKLDEKNDELTKAYAQLEDRNVALERANTQVAREKEIALRERDIAQTINRFVREDLLGQASPEEEPNRSIQLRTVLDRASASIGDRFRAQPLVEAAISSTIGATYYALGEFQLAEPHLTKSKAVRKELLGENHPDTLESMNLCALVYCRLDRYKEAREILVDAVEVSMDALGEQHPTSIASLVNMAYLDRSEGRYSQAEALYSRAFELASKNESESSDVLLSVERNIAVLNVLNGEFSDAQEIYERQLESCLRDLGDDHPTTLNCMNNLAGLYMQRQRFDEAEKLFDASLSKSRALLSDSHPETLRTMGNLSTLFLNQGRLDDAAPIIEERYKISLGELGGDDLNTVDATVFLAILRKRQSRFAEAEPLFLGALEAYRRVLGDEHPRVYRTVNDLAVFYYTQGRFEEAEPLLVETLEYRRKVFGDANPDTLVSMNNLASVYYRTRRYDQAAPLFELVLKTHRHLFGDDHPATLASMSNLASLYLLQGRTEESRIQFEAALMTSLRVRGESSTDTLDLMDNLAGLHYALGEYDAAIEVGARMLRISREHLGDAHPTTRRGIARLALAYAALDRYELAEALIVEQVEYARTTPTQKERLATLLAQLAEVQAAQSRGAEAESSLRECLAIRIETNSESWIIDELRSRLGEALSKQERFEDAEPILIGSFDSLKELADSRPSMSHQRTVQALQRIIDHFERRRDTDSLVSWRQTIIELRLRFGTIEQPSRIGNAPRP